MPQMRLRGELFVKSALQVTYMIRPAATSAGEIPDSSPIRAAADRARILPIRRAYVLC